MKKKSVSSRKSKTISIRKHLPLMVRVHYDAVRNFAPIKAFGMGVMVLIGIFGVLLATQTVSPGTSASFANDVTVVSPNEGVTVTKVSEGNGQLVFNVGVTSGRLSETHSVEYYTLNAARIACSQTTQVNTEPTPRNPVRITSVYSSAATAGANGRHTASFGPSVEKVCVRVRTVRTVNVPPRPQTRAFFGFYAIAVNRGTTSNTGTKTPTVDIYALSQLASNPSVIRAYADEAVFWQHKAIGADETCGSSVQFALHPNTVRTYERSFTLNVPGSMYSYYNGKQLCVKATSQAGGTDYRSLIISLPTRSGTTTTPTTTTPAVVAPQITLRTFLGITPPATLPSNIQVTASADQDIDNWDYIVVENSVFNDYSNAGTINACERLFGLNPARQAQVWRLSGSWSNALASNPNANGLIGNAGGSAQRAVLALNLSHGGRFVCVKASNGNGMDYAGRLLPTAPTTAPAVTTPTTQQPVTPEQPAQRTEEDTDDDAAVEEDAAAEDAAETEDDAAPDGGKIDDGGEAISSTGGDDERNWAQLAGYLLIAGAILGIVRILIVKRYQQQR